ncbi:N-formylglutamate amidohydrolase [Phyllobacterium endophyticum]|jgi:N-formylglutamate amidohydrolase|uniref:N-formylglutamate amidohydrolase n=1 Tax=Phyllobacterium endophyticum TaxID=1149773 RepID=A0A2P7AL23_9HYPH|nr:N-formylglutamate amidohydrolase [Phyllobacterium endophyticum]MBB3233202.1 N-formylglutamate amidohydrolase [Phyllobacterium endophyticum]PSH54904.1 N-formylglutamate amidohydrolase [Phyllobacterium endophyticum]TXR49690.1 N-formylglutamate amidohydrolase [Phyllobacterium endophyticum]TYR43222.1 N-formylglutamate amidohydrolase [Phyllobacterium endophyticum]
MTAERDFPDSPPYELRQPSDQRIPFVFNSPHSGRSYPEAFLQQAQLDSRTIRRSEDCFVDQLFSSAVMLGAPLMVAHFPRAYLDVNREPYELDAKMFLEPLPPYANGHSARVAGGLGTVPRLVGEGQEIYAHKLHIEEALKRIDTIYKPYHALLGDILVSTRERFGYGVLVDCHSMPTGIRFPESGMRPDFIIGDRFGTSCAPELAAAAIHLLRELGYVVVHNKPYAGGYITEHYGRPLKQFHALQIEVNRGLYLNEHNYEKKAGFDQLQRDIALFLRDLVSLPDFHFLDSPLAAE